MKNILITGAGNGIGKAITKSLQNENLLIIDSDEQSLIELSKELSCKYFVCDVSNIKSIENLKDYVNENFSNIDTLINCAGQWTKGELSNLDNSHIKELNTLERIKNLIDTNTFGIIATTTSFAPIMMKNGKGQIVNICSQSAVETEEFCPVYNASKHGSYQYRKAIQRDLAKHNIKITDICPGLVKTDFYNHASDPLSEEIMQTGLSPEDVANAVNYVLNLPFEISIPSLEIRNIKNF